jgi:hypothetical protein
MSDEVHDQKFITDKEGNRVRRGLTHEENNWYEASQRRSGSRQVRRNKTGFFSLTTNTTQPVRTC